MVISRFRACLSRSCLRCSYRFSIHVDGLYGIRIRQIAKWVADLSGPLQAQQFYRMAKDRP